MKQRYEAIPQRMRRAKELGEQARQERSRAVLISQGNLSKAAR